jgi:DNA-binding response OmpR family regulator
MKRRTRLRSLLNRRASSGELSPQLRKDRDRERRRTRRVLVLEDEPTIRQPLEEFLRRCDYDVVCADTAQKGLRLVRSHKPDAAIVNLHLKEGSGRTVILKMPARVPVLIFSGMRSESSELKRARPRTRMVEKPYSLTMLVEHLEEMLKPV